MQHVCTWQHVSTEQLRSNTCRNKEWDVVDRKHSSEADSNLYSTGNMRCNRAESPRGNTRVMGCIWKDLFKFTLRWEKRKVELSCVNKKCLQQKTHLCMCVVQPLTCALRGRTTVNKSASVHQASSPATATKDTLSMRTRRPAHVSRAEHYI